MTESLPTPTRGAEIDRLLERLKTSAPASPATGRLIFALDATASRMLTWDAACRIQGEMFEATAGLGDLSIQLCFYRGFDECKASRWVGSAADLHKLMRSVACIGGHTQIERILIHTIGETKRQKVAALVFVGDAMEEQVDRLCHLAGELGSLGVPIFIFQEGNLSDATATFKQMARLSHGAHLAFDLASIARLKELLGAVAVYATGGFEALEDYGRKHGGEVLQLTHQLNQRRTT
jgi:hypothetical protein